LELASNSFKLTRQHGECLFSSSQWVFFPR
jgi:hypothetical protein